MDTANFLKEKLKLSRPPLLTKLHGDASNRIYYRTRLEGQSAQGESVIVMQLPEGAASLSEEVSGKPTGDELPFRNIQRYLLKGGLPVPKILHELGRVLVLEDLGDRTVEKEVTSHPEEGEIWYRRAIELLGKLQEMREDPHCIAFRRRFDETLLNWEFDHFLEYGIEARQGIKIDPKDLKTIKQGMNFITFGLTKLPQLFVHRDFQSRNLMVVGEKLHLIDFQDALVGPHLYDLVALLRDSYVVLPWSLAHQLIDYYLQLKQKKEGSHTVVFKMFDWMTIQRKLKDAGRFVYIDQVKKNPNFLPFISPSLGYVREAFERQTELHPLFNTLKKYVPEFG